MASFPLASRAGLDFSVEGKKRPEAVLEGLSRVAKLSEVTPASRLSVRPMPEMASSGVAALDVLAGGIPRGCLTEICGAASSGRTSVLLATLAAATKRQETCALVDAGDTFDPKSAAMAEVDFERLLWVRCDGRASNAGETKKKFPDPSAILSKRTASSASVEQALRVTDLLLQSGGFGLVVLDLGSVPLKIARRVPLASWFRFQRAVERTVTILFLVTPAACAQTCATLLLKVQGEKVAAASQSSARSREIKSTSIGMAQAVSSPRYSLAPKYSPAHVQLLDGIFVTGELLRSRLERRPVQSAVMQFITKAG